MIKTVLSLIFALVLGYALTFLSLSIGFDFSKLRWEIWAGAALLSAIGLGFCLFLSRAPKKVTVQKSDEIENLKNEMHRFEKDFKLALRGHLKFSILFWAHYYKKEKIKTFEDAKKEVFLELKKEFPHVRWMETLLEEIRQELLKYK